MESYPTLCPPVALRVLWGFFTQEYWSGLPWPPPCDLPNPGMEPRFSTLQTYSLPSEPPGKPKLWKLVNNILILIHQLKQRYYTNERCLSLVTQMVKNLPTMQKTGVQSLSWEDPLEKGMATHSSILALKITWMEEPGRL